MSCDHCTRAVDRAIRALPGIASCDVSLGEAVVSLDSSVVSRGELFSAVRRAGAYEVTGYSESALA